MTEAFYLLIAICGDGCYTYTPPVTYSTYEACDEARAALSEKMQGTEPDYALSCMPIMIESKADPASP